MKVLFSISIIIVLFSVNIQSVYACTIDIQPLRKNFRSAKHVFVGEILSEKTVQRNDLPKRVGEYLDERFTQLTLITFKVNKSWKGKNQQISVYSHPLCSCPFMTSSFEKGSKFLAFVDKHNFLDTCNSNTYQIDEKFLKDKNYSENYMKRANGTMKRLNSFRFRMWARIYPF